MIARVAGGNPRPFDHGRASAACSHPVGMVWNQAASDCDETGNAYLPSVPTALVQAMSCHESGCSSVVWGSLDGQPRSVPGGRVPAAPRRAAPRCPSR
jgi:hypothetical protein